MFNVKQSILREYKERSLLITDGKTVAFYPALDEALHDTLILNIRIGCGALWTAHEKALSSWG